MKLIDDLKAKLSPKTPAEKERLKKIVVYTILILSCLVCFWIIFAPSGEDEIQAGKANTDLPEQTTEGMPDTKIAAYEQEAMQKDKAQQQIHLEEVASALDTVQPVQPQVDQIQSSADAYQAAQATLQDFYIPDQTSEVAALQERIAELEAEKAQPNYIQQSPNEMELLERSYQLAAQYMGNGNGSNGGSYTAPQQQEEQGKRNVQPVQNVTKKVVSTLSAATNEIGFATAVGTSKTVSKNTIAAVVYGNQSITNGQSVKLRTVEPMWIGSQMIPRNTPIVGAARLQDERLTIVVSSIEYAGSLYEVELQVFDSDGQEGINIPNSMESDALHEIGANMGSTMGSSINISTDAGAQIASDVGRGLINGVSQYLTKKMRTVKVHLKSGYRVMLHQPEDN